MVTFIIIVFVSSFIGHLLAVYAVANIKFYFWKRNIQDEVEL